MEKNGLSIHYGEIALKGKLRSFFEKKLRDNIKYETGEMPVTEQGRLLIHRWDESTKRLLRLTPGISWFGEAVKIDRDEAALKLFLERLTSKNGGNVNLDVRRVDKTFEKTSLELKSKLGRELGLKFSPIGFKLRVEIMKSHYIVNYNIENAIGGVPVGSAGKVLSLFSGGIDSSVAPFELMKRGCTVDLLHVYAVADESAVMQSKAVEIVKKLSEIEPVTLYTVPFHVFSLKAIDSNPRYELVLFKRFLLKLGGEICKRYGYKAVASGDSLSQVASQTLDNINAISYGIDLPVFRPLLSYNKQEIINLAQRYGTYETSIKDYRDCCSLTSKNPLTSASQEKVKIYEEKIGLDSIVEESLAKMKSFGFRNK